MIFCQIEFWNIESIIIRLNSWMWPSLIVSLKEFSLCHISLQPDGVNLWYFKLRLFDPTELKDSILKDCDLNHFCRALINWNLHNGIECNTSILNFWRCIILEIQSMWIQIRWNRIKMKYIIRTDSKTCSFRC